MFTGIIEEIGIVNKIWHGRNSADIEISAKTILADTKVGDSIAVNGICLTVTCIGSGAFTADVMHETLERSALADLRSGSHVNLERAMPANGRFGGHLVAGHIDGKGKILCIRRDDIAVRYTIQAEPEILRYVVEKGSIAVDGISLTVAGARRESFTVSVIPYTADHTTLHERKAGDLVNLETDLVGKYAESLLPQGQKLHTDSRITKEFLTKYGF